MHPRVCLGCEEVEAVGMRVCIHLHRNTKRLSSGVYAHTLRARRGDQRRNYRVARVKTKEMDDAHSYDSDALANNSFRFSQSSRSLKVGCFPLRLLLMLEYLLGMVACGNIAM